MNRKHLKYPLVFATLCLIFALLSGCNRKDSQNDLTSDNPSKPRVALIMKSLANEFFITMAEGGKAHHQKNASQYDLILNGIKDESDIGQQVVLIEQMIAMRVNAIVIAPADSRAIVPVLKRARDAGIVVVNIDNKLDESVLAQAGIDVPFVGPDNREGARMVGEVLSQNLQSGDEVAILEGIPTAFNAQQRRLGFEDAMKAAGMRVVNIQSGQWEQARANTVASAMIHAHPHLKAILASNDNMALGASAAIRQAGKSGQIAVVGFDNIQAIREMIRDGRILATADQHADKLAAYGIEFALQILNGEAVPANRLTPVDIITAGGL